jgi:hypothetical protein
MARTDYRRADTLSDKMAIYRMRYDAYVREGNTEVRPSGTFQDHYDEDPNVWLIGVYIDDELAGSLRLHVASRAEASIPAKTAFPEVMEPRLRAGECIIDGTRFVSSASHARRFPELPYLTLRASFVAEQFFNADYMTAGCRDEHRAFYARMFGCKAWAPSRPYPYLTKLIGLMAYDCHGLREKTYARHPYMLSDAEERQRLFSISSTGVRGTDFVKARNANVVKS